MAGGILFNFSGQSKGYFEHIFNIAQFSDNVQCKCACPLIAAHYRSIGKNLIDDRESRYYVR